VFILLFKKLVLCFLSFLFLLVATIVNIQRIFWQFELAKFEPQCFLEIFQLFIKSSCTYSLNVFLELHNKLYRYTVHNIRSV